MDNNNQQNPETDSQNKFAGLDFIADWMDNKFRIPGTDIRFGLDSLIGFVPGVGDVAGLAVSSYLASVMARRGAGPVLMLKMLGNIALDATVGAIPILGDLFDLGFKANRRNVDLLKKYYASNPNPPSAKWSFGLLLLLFLGFVFLIFWAVWRVSAWGFHALFG